MSALAIIGSRGYKNLSEVRHYVRARLAEDPALTIVSGGARGVDQEAEHAAEMMGAIVVSFRPFQIGTRFMVEEITAAVDVRVRIVGRTYPSYGAACYGRNALIVEEADEVVAFWDGTSSGTKHAVDLARDAWKLVPARAVA